MTRITTALSRAKAAHAETKKRQPPPGTNGHALAAEAAGSVFDVFAKQASHRILDTDALHDKRIVTDEQPLAMRSAYKMLRTRLLQRMRANHWQRLAISSARSGAGKTLTAINTAISIAREPNQRVILVDLDLRRPSVARYLGIEHSPDLTDYLFDRASFDEIVVRPDVDRLLVIPNSSAHENSSELLSSQRMKELVDRLSQPGDDTIVIFDMPPMLDADDLLAFSPQFDALLFIVSESETRRADIQRAENLLEDLELIGVVLNKSNDAAPAYY